MNPTTTCHECVREKEDCTCSPCICAYCVEQDCPCLRRQPAATTDVSGPGDNEQDDPDEDELIVKASVLNLASLYKAGRKTGAISQAVSAYGF